MVSRLAPALALAAALAAAPAAGSPRCPGARYLLSGGALLGSASTIVIDGSGLITIAGACDTPRRVRQARVSRGTRLRARWAACPGFGSVRLVAVMAAGCTGLTGTVRIGRARVPFAATLEPPPTTLTTSTTIPTTTSSTTTTSTSTTTTTDLRGLPADVAGYGSWLRLNAEPIPIHPVGDAHFGTKEVYVNQSRETLAPDGVQLFPYPDGTILVKESIRPTRDFVGLVSIMRKRAGSDPEHGDWEWVEYARASADEAFTEVGRDAVCWTCHAIREPWDWVYTRLE
jgi:hypothetical protein